MPADPSSSRGPRASAGSDPARHRLHPVEWTVQAGAVDDVLREMDARVRHRTRRRLAGAVGGALALLLMAGLLWRQTARPVATGDAARQGSVVVSQPERRTLPDGSVVELRNGARIAVEFAPAVRRIAILEGEAHFDVAKDPHRPFVVAAGAVEVRAVGTVFSVNRGAAGVEVLVREGRVAVERPVAAPEDVSGARPTRDTPATPVGAEAERRPLAIVDAGNRVMIESDEGDSAAPAAPVVIAVSPAELAARLAWRVPRLEFSGTPLAEAVALINRHGHARITLADAVLGDLRISGILRADNLDTLARLLEEVHGITTERRSDTEMILHRGR